MMKENETILKFTINYLFGWLRFIACMQIYVVFMKTAKVNTKPYKLHTQFFLSFYFLVFLKSKKWEHHKNDKKIWILIVIINVTYYSQRFLNHWFIPFHSFIFRFNLFYHFSHASCIGLFSWWIRSSLWWNRRILKVLNQLKLPNHKNMLEKKTMKQLK